MIAWLEHVVLTVVRSHEWTRFEVVLVSAAVVTLAVLVLSTVVDAVWLLGGAARRVWRRRAIQRLLNGGQSRYVDTARVHREVLGGVDRLARRAAARRGDAVTAPTGGVGAGGVGPHAGVSPDLAGEAGTGGGHVAAFRSRVPRPAPPVGRSRDESGYDGTTLIFPSALDPTNRLN